jgi:O-antigen ligase
LALLIALLAVTEGMMGLVMMALHGAGRAYGGVYNPNHHAALVLAGLPLAVALLWNRHERRLLVDGEGLLGGRDIGLMALGFVLAATAGWLGALSRGSILLGAPIVLAWLVWEWWRSNDPEDLAVERWRGPVLSGVVVIMIAGMALGGFGGRLSGGDAEGAAAASSRPELARATLVGLSETRFMGLGLHGAEYAINRHVNFSTRFVPIYTHNDWVQFLAEVGIPGFLILLVCATPAARFAWSNRRMPRRMGLREGRLRRAAMAGLGATVAHGFVDFHLRIPLITMTAVALVVLILSPLDADEWEPED